MYHKMCISTLILIFFLNILIYWSLKSQIWAGWMAQVQPQILEPSRTPTSNNVDPDMKTILLWTTWFGLDSWNIYTLGYSWDGHQHTDLRDLGCDHVSFKCTLTSNRSHLQDESLYDGFLFHQVDINQLDIPDQDKRMENQVYIFNTLESPIHSLHFAPNSLSYDPAINNNFFNVTMTYSSQSEIHIPYGKIVQVTNHPTGEELNQLITVFGTQQARNVTPKKFSAVIFFSNCASLSHREKMLGELGKILQIDAFGGCGDPSPLGSKDGTKEGYTLLGQTYQFYLAFENSLCNDYITEKFFKVLHADMIPIVLNGANMSRIAPKHSYIDVKDFSTVRELGNYLQLVSSNPALYSSYFWWRQYYEVQSTMGRNLVKVFCEACRYLHSGKSPRAVEDLQKKWVEGSQCMQPPIITYLDEEET